MVTLALAFLRGQWKWAIPTAALVVVTLFLGVSRYQLVSERAERASDEAKRVALVNQLNQANRDIENAQAEYAVKLEAEHAQAVEVVNAVIADHAERFANELRRAKRACPGNGVPTSAPAAGVPESNPARSGDRLLEEAARDLAELGARANRLAEYAKSCQKWAARVGR